MAAVALLDAVGLVAVVLGGGGRVVLDGGGKGGGARATLHAGDESAA